MEVGDAQAMYEYELGCYAYGMHGLPQNRDKALELYLRAGELGCTIAYHNMVMIIGMVEVWNKM